MLKHVFQNRALEYSAPKLLSLSKAAILFFSKIVFLKIIRSSCCWQNLKVNLKMRAAADNVNDMT